VIFSRGKKLKDDRLVVRGKWLWYYKKFNFFTLK
jgi:hypothetical protein